MDGDYKITASMVINGTLHTCEVSGNSSDPDRLLAQMIGLTGVQLKYWTAKATDEELLAQMIALTDSQSR